MSSFKHVSELVEIKRLGREKDYTLGDVSSLLGHLNEDLINDIENAKCCIHLHELSRLSEILGIHPAELRWSLLKDYRESLDKFFEETFYG